ncbi:4-amino-4-deoxy-L-arabinose transferase, partial [bacterium]|nr:4-amino-4-deoxy-L-arabinose transferase [bacterium]
AACMLLAVAATLVPWVARNQIASSGHVVVTTSRAGASLYEALNPKADGGPMLAVVTEVPHPPELDEVERDHQLRALAVRYARAHPGRALWLGLVKFARTWNPVPNAREFRSPLLAIGLGVPYVLVMLGAALGVWRAGRRGEVALILLLPVVYYALLHTVFVGSIRYRMPVMPLLVALAAHGACARGRGQPSRPRSVDGS